MRYGRNLHPKDLAITGNKARDSKLPLRTLTQQRLPPTRGIRVSTGLSPFMPEKSLPWDLWETDAGSNYIYTSPAPLFKYRPSSPKSSTKRPPTIQQNFPCPQNSNPHKRPPTIQQVPSKFQSKGYQYLLLE